MDKGNDPGALEPVLWESCNLEVLLEPPGGFGALLRLAWPR